jgi:hypothetical protein
MPELHEGLGDRFRELKSGGVKIGTGIPYGSLAYVGSMVGHGRR